MFESRSRPSTDPLIVWLTGGTLAHHALVLATHTLIEPPSFPSISSCRPRLLFAARSVHRTYTIEPPIARTQWHECRYLSHSPHLGPPSTRAQENGPFSVEPNLSLKRNPYSWNSFANLLYIDQPVGTGTSSSSNVATLHADTRLESVSNNQLAAAAPQVSPTLTARSTTRPRRRSLLRTSTCSCRTSSSCTRSTASSRSTSWASRYVLWCGVTAHQPTPPRAPHYLLTILPTPPCASLVCRPLRYCPHFSRRRLCNDRFSKVLTTTHHLRTIQFPRLPTARSWATRTATVLSTST
jgi:hypothetical protein